MRLSALANLGGPSWPTVERVWLPGSPPNAPIPAGFRAGAVGETILPTLSRSAWLVYLGHGTYSRWDVQGADRATVGAQQATNIPVVVAIGCQTGQLANSAPDGPGGYLDSDGNRHLYGYLDATQTVIADWGAGYPPAAPIQQWTIADVHAIDAVPPAVYQPSADRPTVAAEWLHAQTNGGTVAYFGEQTVAPDDAGAELIGRMMAAATSPAGAGSRLGDLWLAGCRGYWIDFRGDPRWIENARVYLAYMTLYGDPSLRL